MQVFYSVHIFTVFLYILSLPIFTFHSCKISTALPCFVKFIPFFEMNCYNKVTDKFRLSECQIGWKNVSDSQEESLWAVKAISFWQLCGFLDHLFGSFSQILQWEWYGLREGFLNSWLDWSDAIKKRSHELTGIMKSPRLNVTAQTIAEWNNYPHTHNDKYGIKIVNMDGIAIYSNQTIDKND